MDAPTDDLRKRPAKEMPAPPARRLKLTAADLPSTPPRKQIAPVDTMPSTLGASRVNGTTLSIATKARKANSAAKTSKMPKNKPATTAAKKDKATKQSPATASKRAKSSQNGAPALVPKSTPMKQTKTQKPQAVSMFAQLGLGISKTVRESVLIRPTAKALRAKASVFGEGAVKDASLKPDSGKSESASSDKANRICLLDLPKEVLKKIWTFAVVEETCFVYPVSETGKEQPDLAMTCRSIRAAVLPIYYANNIFAIELLWSPRETFKEQSVQLLQWMKNLHAWMPHIRHWVFACEYNAADMQDEPRGALLSIALTHHDQEGSSTPIVEVHADARCLLAGLGRDMRCIVTRNPAWFNKLMIESLEIDLGFPGHMSRKLMGRLLTHLMPNLDLVDPLRCTSLQGYSAV